MKEIRVSTEVYAAIWGKHKPGDETEDDILRRLLEVKESHGMRKKPSDPGDGFYDARNGVHFEEGERIFRVFKGVKYEAEATRGFWRLLNNEQSYKSLNRLTWAVTDNSVNAWEFWKYLDINGKEHKINDKRREDLVVKRK